MLREKQNNYRQKFYPRSYYTNINTIPCDKAFPVATVNCWYIYYMYTPRIRLQQFFVLFVTENSVKSLFREWAVDWNRHPDVHISQRWDVPKDSNLESQLGKGPRQCVNPMGKTSDCSFGGSHLWSQTANWYHQFVCKNAALVFL